MKTFDPGVLDNVAAVNEYLNAQNDFRDELEDNQAAMMESRDQQPFAANEPPNRADDQMREAAQDNLLMNC